MKPADSEQNSSDRKLFVGSLPKTMSDDDLLLMFNPFGELESASILRDRSGGSKGNISSLFPGASTRQSSLIDLFSSTPAGSAFVVFKDKAKAMDAIEALNGKQTLEVN